MITQEQIARINELARKAKTPEGLTPAETEERDILRKAYIASVRANLGGQWENREAGTPPLALKTPVARCFRAALLIHLS